MNGSFHICYRIGTFIRVKIEMIMKIMINVIRNFTIINKPSIYYKLLFDEYILSIVSINRSLFVLFNAIYNIEQKSIF